MVKSSQNLVARQIPNYDNDKLVRCMLLQVCLLYLETGTVLSPFIWQLKIISRSIKVKNLSIYPQYSYFLYKKTYSRNHLSTSWIKKWQNTGKLPVTSFFFFRLFPLPKVFKKHDVTGWLRTARSKRSPRLGASLPEDRSRAGFRNVVSLKNLDDGQSQKKKGECVSETYMIIKNPTVLHW